MHTLSVSRAPADCNLFAYTADRIAKRLQSEFTAVTDIQLQPEHNEQHRFVRDTLRDANIQFLEYGCFCCVGAEAEGTDAMTRDQLKPKRVVRVVMGSDR